MEAAELQKLVPAGGGGPAAARAPRAAQDSEEAPQGGRGKLQLQSKLVSVSVEPEEQKVYERAVQTDLSGDQPEGQSKENRKGVIVKQASNVLKQMADKARTRAVKPDEAATRSAEVKEEEEVAAKEMSQEERDKAMAHPEFLSFFSKATLMVERTLGQQSWDIATDWKDVGNTDKGNGEGEELMKHVDDYVEEKWSKNRPVTDVRFSPHQKEIFLAAYGQKANPGAADPDGAMLVWNLAMRNRPELSFSAPSQVLAAQFHSFDPSLFYGGTYSGSVVLWDARAHATPVLKTPLSGKGHSHPVQALQQVGTRNATNLVTASNDGRICVWSLAMLKEPQEFIELKSEGKTETKNKRDLAVMTLSFPDNETNVLYAGAEDGSVCQVHLQGSKVGVAEMYDGHDGPVAGIDVHPHQSEALQNGLEANFDLALTCSFDWSIKLWMVKQHQSPYLSLDANEDYVYDVKWNPMHPAVFASVDGEGHVDLWNLNQNIESPVVRCESPQQRRLAFNRCHWSTDGQRLAAGDSDGNISLYKVAPSVAQPRLEDFQQFNERVRQLQPILPRTRESSFDRYGLTRGAMGDRH